MEKDYRLIHVFGVEWAVWLVDPFGDVELQDTDGYTDWTTRKIVVAKKSPEPGSVKNMDACMKRVMRHEIIHAFLFESGLSQNALTYSEAWAMNEEMVDWFAFNGPRIYEAWKEADALG